MPFGDDGTTLTRGHSVFVCGTDDLAGDCTATGWVHHFYRIDATGFARIGGNGPSDNVQVFVRRL